MYKAYLNSTGISTDTRNLPAGCMFVALKGANFDANDFVEQALQQGARYVVTQNKAFEGKEGCFVVDDTLKALQDLAAEHRRNFNFPVLGITGTNGKTTTKELCAAVLGMKYKTAYTKGNLNNHIGVPLTLLGINAEQTEIAVVEMGASHPGEIAELAAIAQPSAGLITNVGIAHTEGFGSAEGVMATKKALYDNVKASGGRIFINAGNPKLCTMLGDYDNVFSYGKEESLVEGEMTDEGSETLCFRWRYAEGEWHEVQTNLTGAYNLENALAAVSVGIYYGVAEADIMSALSSYQPTNGRSQIVQTKRNRLIVDAYNANPTSMMESFRNFAAIKADNKMVILGAMRELGALEESMHAELLAAVSAAGIAEAWFVGKEFEPLKPKYPSYNFVADGSEIDCDNISNRYILLKGSHSNRLDKLVEKL